MKVLKTGLLPMFVVGMFASQSSFAISKEEAVHRATAYMKTVNQEMSTEGPIPTKLSNQAELARVVFAKNASPETTYAVVFGVHLTAGHDDSCALVVLVSDKTGHILSQATVPGFYSSPAADNRIKTNRYWYCWLGQGHPDG